MRMTQWFNDVLGNEFLLLHEVVEICFLKSMSYRVSPCIILKAYPGTYRARLKAMELGLMETAERAGITGWVDATRTYRVI